VWQTDGQTSCHGIVRAMHTRREVKMAPFERSYDFLSSYRSAIISIALSCRIFELFYVEEFCYLIRGHWTWHHTIDHIAYKFLLTFHSNYGPIMHRFLDIARYRSKITFLSYLTCVWHPHKGDLCQNIPITFALCYEKKTNGEASRR